jgi:lipocalin
MQRYTVSLERTPAKTDIHTVTTVIATRTSSPARARKLAAALAAKRYGGTWAARRVDYSAPNGASIRLYC